MSNLPEDGPGTPPVVTASVELGPVRTGRERADDTSRPASGVSLSSADNPLPPIGQQQNEELTKVDSAKLRSSMAASSSEQRKSSSSSTSSRRPKIVTAYRREMGDEESDNSKSKRSPKNQQTRQKSSKEPRKEVQVVRDAAGQERTLVSIECQTEWSWLEDMKTSNEQKLSARSHPKTPHTGSSSEGDDDDIYLRDDLNVPEESGRIITPRHALDRKSSRIYSGSAGHPGSALTNKESYISEPFPSRADEYGIPVLNLSSESEDSSDDDSDYQPKESIDQDNAGTLPSIGPPQILQYQRESEQQDITCEDPEERQTVITDEQLEKYKRGAGNGVFEGICDFCNQPVRPFPSMEDQQTKRPSTLFCCNEYREFVQFMVSQPVEEKPKVTIIDVKPHEPFGSKQARKAAKERAAQRMREREMARQQAAMDAARAGGGGAGAAAGFYQFARQMKTINYQLSSQKCLEEGWTLRAPSPLMENFGDNEVFEIEPVLPPWAEAEGKSSARGLIRKLYDDGKTFVVLFPDGTGTVYYPSGHPAIMISSTEQGLYTYVAFDDESEDNPSNMVAVFDPAGRGTTYYSDGTVRLYLDQIGGTELDPRGARRRKWLWKDQVDHVHAPPIQPITFAVTPRLAVRVVSQEHITVTFSCRTRSCRFQVGSRLKLVAPQNLPPPEFDEDDVYRKEVKNKIESIMDRVSNLLKFPKCPRLDKLPAPSHLNSRNQKLQDMKSSIAKSKAAKKEKGQTIITVS